MDEDRFMRVIRDVLFPMSHQEVPFMISELRVSNEC